MTIAQILLNLITAQQHSTTICYATPQFFITKGKKTHTHTHAKNANEGCATYTDIRNIITLGLPYKAYLEFRNMAGQVCRIEKISSEHGNLLAWSITHITQTISL